MELAAVLESLATRVRDQADRAATADELDLVRIGLFGRKGELTSLFKSFSGLPPDERKLAGLLANRAKEELAALIDARAVILEAERFDRLAAAEWVDASLPGTAPDPGRMHPVSRIQREIEGIFTSMGFSVLDGPEVETEHNNFEALNIPAHHPAREMQDTFWLTCGNLLRTHTSPIQVRGMQRLRPPFRVIGPGRVFRYEATDASHENTFYQVEGMMVDREISVANLIHVMKVLLREIFGRETEIRLRPGYFPFVEPGFELDMRCLVCGGNGCPVCKRVGWVEVLPCGLVHPNVLRAGGIDPGAWSGFAFGLGLNRLVMMRYQIDDIRHFMSGDIRFVEQF